jgi:hypothetical protein
MLAVENIELPRARSRSLSGGKFSLGLLSPSALGGLILFEDCTDFFGGFIDDLNHPTSASVFDETVAVKLCEKSDDSVDSTSDIEDFSVESNAGSKIYRRHAIARWKAKKLSRRGVRKVCEARSRVACSRPRVQGKFVKRAEFVSITELPADFFF